MALSIRQSEALSRAARAYASGDADAAAKLALEVLRTEREHPGALHILAASRLAMGDPESAVEPLERALRRHADQPDILQTLANVRMRLGDVAAARAAIDRALALRPEDPLLLAAKAEMLFREREFDEARDLLLPSVKMGVEHIGLALAFGALCPRIGHEEEAIALIERCLARTDMQPTVRMRALFMLGDLNDALERYDAAFARYHEANRMKAPRPDLADYARSIDAMLAAWSTESARALPRPADAADLPVFIVGMPRSGTSLVEQILASHPQVWGAGERKDLNRLVAEIQAGRPLPMFHLHHLETLTRRSVERSSQRIIEHWRKAAAVSGRDPAALARITDKNPVNYVHLGLISVLFPRARVIHCARDPMDTCMSCYFNNIVGIHAFGDTLENLGGWFRSYERIMAHWKATLDTPILDVPYESLVADQEGWTRKMLDFVGLAWSDEAMRFHENRRLVFTPSIDQVRRPVYQSAVGRWRNYEGHLGPLREALGRG